MSNHRFLTRWQAHIRSRVSIHKCVHFHPLSPTSRLIRCKLPGALGYGGVLDADANCYRAGDGFSYHQHSMGFPRTRSPIKGRSHLGYQSSSTEQNYNPSHYGGDQAGFPDSEAASRPYRSDPEIYSRFDDFQATSPASRGIDVLVRANPILSHPTSMVGKQVTTQVPAELPPVSVNNDVTRRSSKRKGSASPDGKREGGAVQPKKRRRLAVQKQSQVSPARIGPTQKRVVITVFSDGPGPYTSAHAPSVHAPRVSRGGTNRVSIR